MNSKYKKVKKRKRTTGYTAKPWTKSETATLLRFVNEGKSQKEIGALLGRTRSAVYCKLKKVRDGRKQLVMADNWVTGRNNHISKGLI